MRKLFLIATSIMLMMPVFAPVMADNATPPGLLQKKIRNNVRNNRQDLRNDLKNLGNNLRKTILGRYAVIAHGQVTFIKGTTLTVTKSGKTYTVNTDSNTRFRRRFWGSASLSEIAVNDMVNVFGKYTDTAQTTIQARMIRDLSIEKRFGVFFGTITSINTNTIVMQTIARGVQTVTVSVSTRLINRREQTIALTDLQVGQRIRVRGMWDRKVSSITEVTQVKDFSLPVINTTPTPTP